MGAGRAIVVMGVTGAGKSTVGELLAANLSCEFLDADNFHSAENKEKMRRGVALTDEDRMPWLETLRDLLIEHILKGQTVVLACSALLPKYRDLLRTADYEFPLEAACKLDEDSAPTGHAREGRCFNSHVVFVYLKCTADLLAARVTAREMAGTHYMPASLLQSQIDALKLDRNEGDILATDAGLTPQLIVEHIRNQLLV